MASSHVTVGSGDHHVLALHGWFGSARGWGSLPGYLDGSSCTYVFMDLRGYGGRKQDPGDFTMEEAAADAVVLADELGWDRFSLIGHSMSGQAIQHVLLAEPGRVRRLVARPVMEQTWLQFCPAAELEVMPNAGHYPMFETPAALAASIEDFLDRD
jgi:pimeloyl-ACP methyl ester carboxylesterase